MSGEERENLGHLLNDILEPRVMTEAEAKFLESLPVAEFPLKRKGPAMNDQAETSDLATLRAENERLNEIIGCYSRDSMRLRSRLAAAERLASNWSASHAYQFLDGQRNHYVIYGSPTSSKWKVSWHRGAVATEWLDDEFTSPIDAYMAAVNAGWLPAAAKGGE